MNYYRVWLHAKTEDGDKIALYYIVHAKSVSEATKNAVTTAHDAGYTEISVIVNYQIQKTGVYLATIKLRD